MKILVTGAAGFIGYHVVKHLLSDGHEVVGIDNLNTYYDVQLKYARLAECGIEKEKIKVGLSVKSTVSSLYHFIKADINNCVVLYAIFEKTPFTHVVHLAAQAGVRYSLQNPYAYLDSNISGFLNVLEVCRCYPVKHLVYASSSSVYGANTSVPYKESDQTDQPVSLYAATKKANELMAHAYSNLYDIPTTGIRFFTVYGPWGRPDMAPSLFMSHILQQQPIRVYNHGNMRRDFTYIDDIVTGVLKIIPVAPTNSIPHEVYNIGCSTPIRLMDFIASIEAVSGKKAIMEMMDMQPGDVKETYADTSLLEKRFGYKPSTSLNDGISVFYNWFQKYYKIH